MSEVFALIILVLLLLLYLSPAIKEIIDDIKIKNRAEKIEKIILSNEHYSSIDERYKYYINEVSKINKFDLEDEINEINKLITYGGECSEFLERKKQKQEEYKQYILLDEEYLKARKDYDNMIETIKKEYKI